jgi:hypothetical protein
MSKRGDLEGVGTAELVSEVLKISKELTRRKGEFDTFDLWRTVHSIENLAAAVSEELFIRLSKGEQALAQSER